MGGCWEWREIQNSNHKQICGGGEGRGLVGSTITQTQTICIPLSTHTEPLLNPYLPHTDPHQHPPMTQTEPTRKSLQNPNISRWDLEVDPEPIPKLFPKWGPLGFGLGCVCWEMPKLKGAQVNWFAQSI